MVNKYSIDRLFEDAKREFEKEYNVKPNDITKQELLRLIEVHVKDITKKDRLKGKGFFSRFARFIAQKAYNVGKAITAPARFIAKKHPVGKIIGKILAPRLDRFSNTSKDTLLKYGNDEVVVIELVRTPINEKLNSVLNGISFGQWRELMDEYGFDKLYHLGMVCTLINGRRIIVEKNEEINVNTNWNENVNHMTSYKKVNLRGQKLSINEMLFKTEKAMGEYNFFDYDAFTNNCQVFIQTILTTNNLINPQLNKFLYQDVKAMTSKLPKYVGKIAKGTTRLGNIFAKLTGKGIRDKREIPEDFSSDVNDIFETITFKNGKLAILGSMRFKSTLYASDYDLYQIVNVSSFKNLETQFKKMIEKIRNMENVVISDIKVGSVEKWRIFDEYNFFFKNKSRSYNREKFKKKINELYKNKTINKQEKDKSIKLLVDNPTIEDLSVIKKELRFNVLRWTAKEILKGEKNIRGETYKLIDAFKDPSIFKMDIIALIGGRFVEFSIMYELRDKKGLRINLYRTDIKKSIEEDIAVFKYTKNYSKLAKRLFSLLNYKISKNPNKKDINKLTKIIDIFNSDVGLLYQVKTDMKVLMELLEDHKQDVSIKDIDKEIDNFINRLSHIYTIDEFLEKEDNILKHIRYAYHTKSKNKKYQHLKNLQEEFTNILNKKVGVLLEKNKLI